MAAQHTRLAVPGRPQPIEIACRPAGKRRLSAWLDGHFLGHAVERVDGTWSGKTPDERTHPGCRDLESALRQLLALRAGVHESLAQMEQSRREAG